MNATLAFGQFAVQFGNWKDNAWRVEQLAKEAHEADVFVLPELALTGYDFRDRQEVDALAEPFDGGPTSGFLRRLAREHRMSVVMGYPEKAEEGCYNSCMIALPSGTLHNYRKIHLFNREKEIFQAGSSAPPVIDTPAGKLGVMICFDWFFPEVARSLALRGAQVIAHPANLVLEWCQRAMFARSVENGVFTITANRIGAEERAGRRLEFTGGSQILGPRGETLVQAPSNSESVGITVADIAAADDKTIAEKNDLFSDRRPELYTGLD
jgi:predicted amidohydrolase